jgi:tRNA(Arg) A34 adenosine deaminase TadA
MSPTDFNPAFMEMAAQLSIENIDRGGGPFGAVIVGADGEVSAIRAACAKLHTFQLTGCTVYSSCEPCPMCLSALYWAGVSKIYYGNTKEDADAIDFSDKFIYEELDREKLARRIPCIAVDKTHTIRAFQKWAAKPDKVKY